MCSRLLYICDMMRKLTVLIMLTLYSSVAIGVPLHYHYCAGELQHITLFAPSECTSHDDTHKKVEEPVTCCEVKTVSNCNEADSLPDCCDDQTELLQLDESVTALIFLQNKYTDAVVACEFVELPSVLQKEDAQADPIHVLRSNPVLPYLEHCSLIFYG